MRFKVLDLVYLGLSLNHLKSRILQQMKAAYLKSDIKKKKKKDK